MAQPPGWKAMYQQVVREAHGRCAGVEHRVEHWRTALASPPVVLDTRDAAGVYTLFQSAVTDVEHASDALSAFIIDAVAAERLVLHGCSAVPSQPVAHIADLRDHHHDEWLALRRLEDARDHAQVALPRLDRAFMLLGSVRYMLLGGNPGAAARRQAMEEQLQAAAVELQLGVASVANVCALARMATEPPIGNRVQ